jgi:curved DNA-binding protein CbpA
MKDYYYILGLSKEATQDDIKKAYRKLSLKFHPDQNNGDLFFEERFKDIKEAYDTLNNESSRKKYDEIIKPINVKVDYTNTESEKKETHFQPKETNSPTIITDESIEDKYWYSGLLTLIIFIIAAGDLFYFNYLGESIDIFLWIGATLYAWYIERLKKKLSKK